MWVWEQIRVFLPYPHLFISNMLARQALASRTTQLCKTLSCSCRPSSCWSHFLVGNMSPGMAESGRVFSLLRLVWVGIWLVMPLILGGHMPLSPDNALCLHLFPPMWQHLFPLVQRTLPARVTVTLLSWAGFSKHLPATPILWNVSDASEMGKFKGVFLLKSNSDNR